MCRTHRKVRDFFLNVGTGQLFGRASIQWSS